MRANFPRADEVEQASERPVTADPAGLHCPSLTLQSGGLISLPDLLCLHLQRPLRQLPSFLLFGPAVSDTSIEAKVNSKLWRFGFNQ